MKQQMERLMQKTLLWLAVAVFLSIFIILPFYWMIKTSFESTNNLFSYPPALFVKDFVSVGWRSLYEDQPVLVWLKNSLIVSNVVMVVSMILATLSAYSLSRYRNRLNNTIGFLILITQMLPGTLFMLPIYIIFSKLGLVNTYAGCMIAFTTFSLPICMWMLKGYFDSVPIEVEQAAHIDGCTHLGALFRVVLPLALPGYVCTAIFGFINSWNEFMMSFILMTNSSKWLMSNGLASFIGEFSTPWNTVMAAALVYTLPPVVLFMFLQKYLVQGLTAGAVKG
jgi:ABC-type glycerol-3-phosphate transport system permease component